jgi:hypothetical protein
MHRQRVWIVLVSLLATGLTAQADRIGERWECAAERVAKADAVVLGKVESIEDKTVKAQSPFGAEVEYAIAVVKVAKGISGVEGLTHVKVAFPLAQNPGGKIRPGRPVPPKLEKDQEVCLLLTKHPTESFFILTNANQVLDKQSEIFEKEFDQIKAMARLMENPDGSLKSKDADERFHTAAMLIVRYRTPVGPNPKTEAIDAEQSKAILGVLAESDLKKRFQDLQNWDALSIFYRLGLTEKDGWKFPENANEQKINDAVKAWLKDNAGSYRIKRFVYEKEKKEERKDK